MGKRKKKRKRKRKQKTLKENKGHDPLGSIVTDLASIFESFLSSVTDVPKDDEAIKLIRIIADSGTKAADAAKESAPDILKGAVEVSSGITGIIKDVVSTVEKLGADLGQE